MDFKKPLAVLLIVLMVLDFTLFFMGVFNQWIFWFIALAIWALAHFYYKKS